jgi:hypothetical protein
MFPYLQVKSQSNDLILDEIISIIESINCSGYFTSHLSQNQKQQKVIVAMFQQEVFDELKRKMTTINWELEYKPSATKRDAIDIYGENHSFAVAIELDKHRADQVAKKFVSRLALLPQSKIYYISLCYPGTAKMQKPEAIKYFGYCSNLANKMNNIYAGFTVE